MSARALRIAVGLVALGAAGASAAGDGVLEISQACAATGCGPGDAPGFPIETEPGKSYVLTSDLEHDGGTLLRIAEGASLDLNGFAVAGPNVCTGVPASCPFGPVSGAGIVLARGASARNGTVRGHRGTGIDVEGDNRIEGMLIEHNGSAGIYVGTAPAGSLVVTGCIVRLNGWDAGIRYSGAATDGTFRDNVIYGNEGRGIQGTGMLVDGNTLTRNGSFGVDLAGAPGAAYGRNLLTGNNGAGAQANGGTQLGANVCRTDTACP